MFSRRITIPLLAGLLATLIFGGGVLIYRGVVAQQNQRHLQELSDHTLRRAELAVDLVVMTVADLLMTAETDCGQHTVNSLRKAAFHVGNIKDIHLILPGKHCSGFVDLVPTRPALLTSGKAYPTTNTEITLSRIDDGEMSGLAVTRQFQRDRRFVAVLDLESMIFDVLPTNLRDTATMAIKLGQEAVVAKFGQFSREQLNAEMFALFDAASERYPVSVHIALDNKNMAIWNDELPSEVLVGLIAIALVLGLLIARGLLPRPTRLDELDRALAAGEIVPYFQPVVSMSDNSVMGCEMLARWIKPDGTSVSPAVFIPLAEANGRADQLMDRLLNESGRLIGHVVRQRPDFKFAFNATPEQFLAPGFVKRVQSIAARQALPLNQLVVEVTERQEIACGETAWAVTNALNAIGVRVAIDDAGTGHNGLASIQTLGAQFLKIDKLFIDRIASDERNRTLVEMLIRVGREYKMSIVAEGIEDADQVKALLALGVRYGQGFLYSPAVDAATFARICRSDHIVPPEAEQTHSLVVVDDDPAAIQQVA